MKGNEKSSMILRSCSPPQCGCIELELIEDLNGDKLVVLSDSTGGVVIDTQEEFNKLIFKYIKETKLGFI